MKKYSLFFLAALGLVMASCDETDIPESKPQENLPQNPLVIGDITVEADGPLASATPLDLNSYVDDLEALLPVLTLTQAENVPEGADISFQMEMSNNDTFAKHYMLYPQYGDTEETSKTVYVSVGDWNNAHEYVVGRNPKLQTIYYRISVYVNVDGSSYRYGSTDYYILSGTVQEMCIDSGFSIEDAYYFMSNATTWSFSDIANYPFYHDPEVSPYDDPVFTYVYYQSGDNWWKVCPQSAIDKGGEPWDMLYGTLENGDPSEMGVLTNLNAESGLISGAGKFEFKINMETLEYNIYPLAGSIYLVGAPSAWSTEASNTSMALAETAVGSKIYTGTYEIPEGKFQFRFYHALVNNWDLFSIGSQNADAGVSISFTDGVYSGPVYQEGVNCSMGKGNWEDSSWPGGKVEFKVDLNDFTIVMKAVN